MTKYSLLSLLLALLVVSCARMGRPDGGWYDETPPHVIGAAPADGGTNARANKVYIYFDEYIKVGNATEKVVISPPQMEQAEIKASGKKIEVQLKDSLKENTTYTIDFSDAIADNNEGNPLGNYTYSFATGSVIDTLQVSGYVLQAENLEPVKGTLVGLYDEHDDSCFITKPMLRVARTDSRGRFCIKGVSPGAYRIYALNDADGNYRFTQKSEQIAFCHDTINPGVEQAVRQDTIWLDSLRIKDIQRTGYTRFTPDDIVLRAFNETITDRYFLKAERIKEDRFSLFFSYGSDEMPVIKPLNFKADNNIITIPSLNRDTITYWLADTTLVNQDTLSLSLTYMMTDSLGLLVPNTDTLTILSKLPYERRLKLQQNQYEEWKKQQEKLKKRGQPYDSVMPRKLFVPKIDLGSTLDPDCNVPFRFDRPVAKIDTNAIHLYAKHDTLWYKTRLKFEPLKMNLRGDSVATPSMMEYRLIAEWRPDVEYSLELDSMAFVDIYGNVSPKDKQGFKVNSLDSYSTLMLMVDGLDASSKVQVQLLDAQDKAVKQTPIIDGTAQFFYIKPGKYYARLFVDDNDNGRWDTGDYNKGLQPEMVYYYPKEIECKEKWDITLNWNVKEKALYQQKPEKITKQKADKQKQIKQRNLERAQKLGIPYPF